jgi:hypothetical protein
LPFLPTSTSWLNLTEPGVRDLDDKAARRGVFRFGPNLVEACVHADDDCLRAFAGSATSGRARSRKIGSWSTEGATPTRKGPDHRLGYRLVLIDGRELSHPTNEHTTLIARSGLLPGVEPLSQSRGRISASPTTAARSRSLSRGSWLPERAERRYHLGGDLLKLVGPVGLGDHEVERREPCHDKVVEVADHLLNRPGDLVGLQI